MQTPFNPKENFENSRNLIGFVPLSSATQDDYDRIGFMSGLEVHQQLLTKEKLFCRCPAGVFQKGNEHDAELVRHMRPTLSELGEYDGTALMEFKTKKNIIYRIKNETACTYDVDDTPPFPMNREALAIAIEISLLCKLNIVGEVHITRKQYLDGSIPTGFQRTAIIGVEGEIPLKNKTVRLIQLSIEEDSCREISDIGHTRVYKTDRLGMPLIETVTYPDCANPGEVAEACDYIRFLNRGTGKVRTGIGASRQDVNVSCKGGSRVEIKGVAHVKWIPKLTHNEAFRQWALLHIKSELLRRIPKPSEWRTTHAFIDKKVLHLPMITKKEQRKYRAAAMNLPEFKGMLSHFLQPGKTFADELRYKVKVVACIELPNLTHSEEFAPMLQAGDWQKIRVLLGAAENDAQVLLWGPEEDISTAIETIDERCKIAFEGVPKETRKSLPDGTTIFERVLPGADRMYPDTDSAPIPLSEETIGAIQSKLPPDVSGIMERMREWNVPQDTVAYILRKNLFPLLSSAALETAIPPKYIAGFLGRRMKYIEGRYKKSPDFRYAQIKDLFLFLQAEKLDLALASKMLPVIFEHPNMDMQSVLMSIHFKRVSREDIVSRVDFLRKRFIGKNDELESAEMVNWIMGQVRKIAEGNMPLREVRAIILPGNNK